MGSWGDGPGIWPLDLGCGLTGLGSRVCGSGSGVVAGTQAAVVWCSGPSSEMRDGGPMGLGDVWGLLAETPSPPRLLGRAAAALCRDPGPPSSSEGPRPPLGPRGVLPSPAAALLAPALPCPSPGCISPFSVTFPAAAPACPSSLTRGSCTSPPHVFGSLHAPPAIPSSILEMPLLHRWDFPTQRTPQCPSQ